MDWLNLTRVQESDFDAIIASIGGRRAVANDSREKEENADYIVGDSAIELKLVEEEPSAKQPKQKKLAHLFGCAQETVVMDAEILSESEKNIYYSIFATPLKMALKKASKQLRRTSERNHLQGPSVAIVINNGLYALCADEFENLAFRCASHDTHHIDILLVGGVYYYSDKWNYYCLMPLKEYYINRIESTDLVSNLRTAWNDFCAENYMRRNILEMDLSLRTKEPVKDIAFLLGSTLYVKPPPSIGDPSGDYRREDSTGLTAPAPAARVIPLFTLQGYNSARESIYDTAALKSSFAEYNHWVKEEIACSGDLQRPVIGFEIPDADCSNASSYEEIRYLATQLCDKEMKQIFLHSTKPLTEKSLATRYILVTTMEIGIDQANDVSSIYFISEFPFFETKTSLVSGKRMKFLQAKVLAAAYAIREKCSVVYYVLDQRYVWK